ncbi:MAG TPA: UDP-N-acetylglucosamine 2-epimerase (non-hydrolyzing) [Candidatus Polarisedimenticolaceae bacterium]|nr:UDP-N-acetylglucosamine 2-epimerase (non-hydrolyzing) [Candidatus Polarisedimenticolaceae bacterium]
MSREVILIAGARPNFMKIAPIAAAMRADGRLAPEIVHTEQHYDRVMSELFFEQLGIPEPTLRLGVGSGSHAKQTAEVMIRLEPVLAERRPRGVLVVGDVNSTVAATLVAVKLGIPVAHVEAGLRSFDRGMPEEINRILTDAVSDLLFVSEKSGVDNLAHEGIDPKRVHFVGNVMIDTLLRFRERALALSVPETMGLARGSYAVLTMHRPANVDDPARLAEMLSPVSELGERLPVLFPVHPRTKAMLASAAIGLSAGVRLVEPLGYLEFLGLLASAGLVLTDSGGIQEETTVLGVPCVTLRDNTERPVTIELGTNRLAGVRADGIRRGIADALAAKPRAGAPPLWDGRAAERVVTALAAAWGD